MAVGDAAGASAGADADAADFAVVASGVAYSLAA